MSPGRRREMVDREHPSLSLEIWPESGVGRPAAILGVNKHSEG